MTKDDVVSKINQLQLPLGQYIVMGGATLAVRGIRETKDLDILVTPALFEELKAHFPLDPVYEAKWHRQRLKAGEVEFYPDFYYEKIDLFFDVADLINDAEMIEGIPFQKLEHLMNAKLDTAREKDLQDVALIQNYLARTV